MKYKRRKIPWSLIYGNFILLFARLSLSLSLSATLIPSIISTEQKNNLKFFYC
jgi:hypothetical protein